MDLSHKRQGETENLVMSVQYCFRATSLFKKKPKWMLKKGLKAQGDFQFQLAFFIPPLLYAVLQS